MMQQLEQLVQQVLNHAGVFIDGMIKFTNIFFDTSTLVPELLDLQQSLSKELLLDSNLEILFIYCHDTIQVRLLLAAATDAWDEERAPVVLLLLDFWMTDGMCIIIFNMFLIVFPLMFKFSMSLHS